MGDVISIETGRPSGGVVAVDLDNTLADIVPGWDYTKEPHFIGPVRPHAALVLSLFKAHDWRTILWSVRCDEWHLRGWADEKLPGLIDAININPWSVMKHGFAGPKVSADLYIDDMAYPIALTRQPVDWLQVLVNLFVAGIFRKEIVRQFPMGAQIIDRINSNYR